MRLDGSRPDLTLASRTARLRRLITAPKWLLRARLRWTQQAIDTLERQLNGEFGLSELAPVHEELRVLVARRDALVERLAA